MTLYYDISPLAAVKFPPAPAPCFSQRSYNAVYPSSLPISHSGSPTDIADIEFAVNNIRDIETGTTIVAGPGAAMAAMWAWREEALTKRVIVTPKK
jgi:hypothetical protein